METMRLSLAIYRIAYEHGKFYLQLLHLHHLLNPFHVSLSVISRAFFFLAILSIIFSSTYSFVLFICIYLHSHSYSYSASASASYNHNEPTIFNLLFLIPPLFIIAFTCSRFLKTSISIYVLYTICWKRNESTLASAAHVGPSLASSGFLE